MIDDIFNSPTVVIRNRRQSTEATVRKGVTPDRKAFSDITNGRPMETPECYRGKSKILPYRGGNTPITPGIEHLFLSDLDNTASPGHCDQSTLNGLSCDLTTDCSADDSCADACSPERVEKPAEEAAPRRKSLYSHIMQEAVFSIPRSPPKTGENDKEPNDSSRSMAETNERSPSDVIRRSMRLTQLDSDSDCGEGDISNAGDNSIGLDSDVHDDQSPAVSPIDESQDAGDPCGEDEEAEMVASVARSKEKELQALRAKLEEQEQLTDLLAAHVPAEATLEARAMAQTIGSSGKDWTVMAPIPENDGATAQEGQERALALSLALELKKAREGEEEMRESVQSAEERAAGLEHTLRNAVSRLKKGSSANADERGRRLRLVRSRLEAALAQLEEEGRVKDQSIVSATSASIESSVLDRSVSLSPCQEADWATSDSSGERTLDASTPKDRERRQSEAWHEHWYRGTDAAQTAPTGLSPVVSRSAVTDFMELSVEGCAAPRARGAKRLALGWIALAGVLWAWCVVATAPTKMVGVY